MTQRARRRIFRRGGREKGMILAVAILVIVLTLIMTVPFLFKSSAQFRSSDRAQKAVAAFNLAEAGVDRTLWEMNQFFAVENGITWDENMQGTQTIRNLRSSSGTRVGGIDILISSPSEDTPVTRAIDSTGKIPYLGELTVNRTVRVNLEQYYKSIWDFGFFADDGVYVRTNILIDSFNSNRGAYGDSNRGHQGHLGTNATGENAIDVEQGTSSAVFGNLAAGVGSDPDNLGNIINVPTDDIFQSYEPETVPAGERRILIAPFDLPSTDLYSLPPRDMFGTSYNFSSWFTSPPDVSAPLASDLLAPGINHGTYSPGKGDFVLTPDDSGVYTDFNLNKSDVTISGHVALYVTGLDGATGSFEMGVGSSLTIGPDSSLTLIFGKTSYEQANNSFINNSGAATNLVILGTDQFTGTMEFKTNAINKVAVYIPRAEFKVTNSNTDIFGAVVCRRFNFPVNVNLHYDEALKDLDDLKGGIPYWRITSWQERRGRS